MTTPLNRAVRRKVLVREYGRAGDATFVVEIAGDGIRMRRLGTRHWYGPLPWGLTLLRAAQVDAEYARQGVTRSRAATSAAMRAAARAAARARRKRK